MGFDEGIRLYVRALAGTVAQHIEWSERDLDKLQPQPSKSCHGRHFYDLSTQTRSSNVLTAVSVGSPTQTAKVPDNTRARNSHLAEMRVVTLAAIAGSTVVWTERSARSAVITLHDCFWVKSLKTSPPKRFPDDLGWKLVRVPPALTRKSRAPKPQEF